MTERPPIFVVPAVEGTLVRDPLTREPLAADGEDKPDDKFWRRRLNAGDVVIAPRPKSAKAPAKKES